MSFLPPREARLLAATPAAREAQVAIRVEAADDAPAIRDLLAACFPGFAEADLVDRLRADGQIVLSLAAEDEGVLIGYIAFSRLRVDGPDGATATGPASAVALAPLAVYPDYQNIGTATRLVREGHACLASFGETLSVVLGEPAYYGRFGYSHRRAEGFACEYQSPFLLAISFGAAPRSGRLVYPQAFSLLDDDAPPPADRRI